MIAAAPPLSPHYRQPIHTPCTSDLAEAVLEALGGAQQILDSDPQRAKALVDRAATLLTRLTLAEVPGGSRAQPASGLAPWQMRKIDRYIDDNFHRSICNRDIAAIFDLSASHFARLFKATVGLTAQEAVTRHRVARTQAAISGSSLPLCQIALDCGFCDQAHMNRTFQRVVGQTPRAWRSATRAATAA